MFVITNSLINFHFFFIVYNIFFWKYYYKFIPSMGLFLNGLLEPKISPLPSYSPPCFFKKIPFLQFQILYRCWPKIQPFSTSLYPTHTTNLLEIQPFPISFCTPVFTSPDKAPTPNAGETVAIMNGINPANAGKHSSSIFVLHANCVFDIFIAMPFFSSYA